MGKKFVERKERIWALAVDSVIPIIDIGIVLIRIIFTAQNGDIRAVAYFIGYFRTVRWLLNETP